MAGKNVLGYIYTPRSRCSHVLDVLGLFLVGDSFKRCPSLQENSSLPLTLHLLLRFSHAILAVKRKQLSGAILGKGPFVLFYETF